jgi:peptidoglycan-N-acetylglucosamine deacetylase
MGGGRRETFPHYRISKLTNYFASMFYVVKTPWWLKKLFGKCTWEMPSNTGKVYLSFDDGPHPEITPFVLETLAKYDARGSFFCIGDNVSKYPQVFQRIIDEGHSVGNHSYHHLNGWETRNQVYFDDIQKASELISSNMFRPPYGKLSFRQVSTLMTMGLQPIMWTVLSGDFDTSISKEKVAENVLKNLRPGVIVVFHDSEKAETRMKYALPLVLRLISERGWVAEKL